MLGFEKKHRHSHYLMLYSILETYISASLSSFINLKPKALTIEIRHSKLENSYGFAAFGSGSEFSSIHWEQVWNFSKNINLTFDVKFATDFKYRFTA